MDERVEGLRRSYQDTIPSGGTRARLGGSNLALRLDLETSIGWLVDDATESLRRLQAPDGHWIFELEADATIPAEYVLLEHFLDDIDDEVEAGIGSYLRRTQADHGGWPLFKGGAFDLSASVKAYYALKLTGDDPENSHMRRAREAILAHGGAAHANVFTRISLALFGQVPWRAVPTMPVELMHLPRWFPFHMTKVSYWSRTVIAPLIVLMALRPKARNPRNIGIEELFVVPPDQEKHYLVNPTGKLLGAMFLALDKALRTAEPFFPGPARRRAIKKATKFFTKRLNGEDGLGGIFPAMANAVMAMDQLGYERIHPDYVAARNALRRLLVRRDDEAYCQPCLSPVWDTALSTLAMLEADPDADDPAIAKAVEWLVDRQVTDIRGDWTVTRPNATPGGWAFQYNNAYYPDTDDSAAVLVALNRSGDPRAKDAIGRGIAWILGMQNENGGWGSFDADNTQYYLNHIPFADHGALLDPPTADVSARCVAMLCECGYDRKHPAVARGLDYLRGEQEADGSWYGRWGTNYVYGTWSVLTALNAAGEDMQAPHIRKAVDWLTARQQDDGGWGEDCASYWPERHNAQAAQSLPTQTAWALLALMAAGEVDSPAVADGIAYLMRSVGSDCSWSDDLYNAVGFPRVFFLKYHGYARYFPLWAIARYQRLRGGASIRTGL